jgi:hypothetical protein
MFARFSPAALLVALLSLLFLWRSDNRGWRRACLVGMAWCPLLISLNPLAGALLQPRIGYLFVRFLGIIPFAAVAAAVAADAWHRRSHRTLTGWPVVVLICALALMRAPAFFALTSSQARERDYAVSPERWRTGFDLLDENLSPGTSVVTDPITGYCVPAYTSERVVAVLDQHSSPSDSTLPPRLEDVVRVLNPYRPLSEAIEIMNRRQVRHVFLNQAFIQQVGSHFDVRLPAEEVAVRSRFEAPDGPFRKVGEAGDCYLYELVTPDWTADSTAARTSYPTALAADVDTSESRPLNEAFSLVAIEIWPKLLHPGDTLQVVTRLRKDRDEQAATPYRIVFRGRQVLAGEHARFSGIDRLYSRLLRQTGGPVLEFGLGRRVLGGRYPPSIWDEGEIIEDRFEVPLPLDLEPGRYRLGFRMLPQRFVRNIALRDWLRPSGGIGMPVGEIVVSEARTQGP